jgi:hypothetical protein
MPGIGAALYLTVRRKDWRYLGFFSRSYWRRGPWRGLDDVELDTLEWDYWHDDRSCTPPATTPPRSSTRWCSTVTTPPSNGLGVQHPEFPDSPGRFTGRRHREKCVAAYYCGRRAPGTAVPRRLRGQQARSRGPGADHGQRTGPAQRPGQHVHPHGVLTGTQPSEMFQLAQRSGTEPRSRSDGRVAWPRSAR